MTNKELFDLPIGSIVYYVDYNDYRSKCIKLEKVKNISWNSDRYGWEHPMNTCQCEILFKYEDGSEDSILFDEDEDSECYHLSREEAIEYAVCTLNSEIKFLENQIKERSDFIERLSRL